MAFHDRRIIILNNIRQHQKVIRCRLQVQNVHLAACLHIEQVFDMDGYCNGCRRFRGQVRVGGNYVIVMGGALPDKLPGRFIAVRAAHAAAGNHLVVFLSPWVQWDGVVVQ